MNKLITLLLFTYSISLTAQIDYLETDGPKVGISLSSRIFETPSLLNIDTLVEPGGNRSWDVRGSYIDNGKIEYTGIQNLYFKSHFPGANLAKVLTPNSDSSYTMMKKNSSGLFFLGTHNKTNEIVFSPEIMLLPFPLSFGLPKYENYSSADFVDNSINLKVDFSSNSIVEAWGIMTTNDGNFPVIKLKTKILQFIVLKTTGAPFADATIETHSWLTSGLAEALVELTIKETDIEINDTTTYTTHDTTLINPFNQLVSNQDIQKSGLKLSITPNPVTDEVTIESKEVNFSSASYSIINAEGKTLLDGNLKANEKLHLNLKQLTSGNYLVQMLLDKKTLLFDILSKN